LPFELLLEGRDSCLHLFLDRTKINWLVLIRFS
jgi:hypothetical protein